MIYVKIDGIFGHMGDGSPGVMESYNTTIGVYLPGTGRTKLIDIVRAHLSACGYFQDPKVFGLRLVHVRKNTVVCMHANRTTEVKTEFHPVITPELSAYVAFCDHAEYPLPFDPNKVHAVVEHDAFYLDCPHDYDANPGEYEFWTQEALDMQCEDLDTFLGEFWDRNLERPAPPNHNPEIPDEYDEWSEWAGEGYFIVEAHNVGWRRASGHATVRIEDGEEFMQFMHRQDNLGRFKATFYGDRIEVTFSGHDTMSGLLTFYPCPDNDWSD